MAQGGPRAAVRGWAAGPSVRCPRSTPRPRCALSIACPLYSLPSLDLPLTISVDLSNSDFLAVSIFWEKIATPTYSPSAFDRGSERLPEGQHGGTVRWPHRGRAARPSTRTVPDTPVASHAAWRARAACSPGHPAPLTLSLCALQGVRRQPVMERRRPGFARLHVSGRRCQVRSGHQVP